MLYNTTPDQLYEPRTTVINPVGYGKVALVTGCASGIGLACTQLLLEHQFSVCGVDRSPFDYNLLRVADHGRFHFHLADLVTDANACDEAVRICLQAAERDDRPRRVDLLVNVAGVLDNFASADHVTDSLWDHVLAVNLTVPVRMMRAVLAPMKEQAANKTTGDGHGGVIINVASTAAVSGAVAGIAYTASKHGLVGATKNVAWRFRNEGIRCNAVLPGAVDSSVGQSIANRVDEGLDAGGFAEAEPVLALQAHTQRPETASPSSRKSSSSSNTGTDITALEVARAILFLASDAANSINGVCLPVDKAWGVM